MTIATATSYRMQAIVRLAFGGESVDRLRDELRRRQPMATLAVEPSNDDETAARIRWELPCASPYGEACFAAWRDFEGCVRRAFGRAAEEDLYGVRFRVLADAGPVGRVERRQDAGGWRDHLDGQALHCGDPIDLLQPGGTWLRGRYELASGADREAVFLFPLWNGEGCVPITPHLVARIPPR